MGVQITHPLPTKNNNRRIIMSKSIFPTFEEIEEGYQVFATEFYKGQDEDDNPIWGERLNLGITIAHSTFWPLMSDVIIKRNRKQERTGFQVKIAGLKSPQIFPYTSQGWDDCIIFIKHKIAEIRKYTERILNER